MVSFSSDSLGDPSFFSVAVPDQLCKTMKFSIPGEPLKNDVPSGHFPPGGASDMLLSAEDLSLLLLAGAFPQSIPPFPQSIPSQVLRHKALGSQVIKSNTHNDWSCFERLYFVVPLIIKFLLFYVVRGIQSKRASSSTSQHRRPPS